MAHWQALELIGAGQVADAINLGTASGASVKQIVDLCKSISGRDIPVNVLPRRSGDPAHLVANNEKAANVLGWKPQYDLAAIIRTPKWEQNRRY